MLASQSGGFKAPHRADQPQRNFRPTLERHFSQNLDLLGMETAFDEHIAILIVLLFRRQLDPEVA
jgi:hypothetical protein